MPTIDVIMQPGNSKGKKRSGQSSARSRKYRAADETKRGAGFYKSLPVIRPHQVRIK
jgi:hypothetical protein